MSQHIKFNITKAQADKIKKGIVNRESISLRLNKNKISPSGIDLILTSAEVRLLDDGINHIIEFPVSRLVKIGKNLDSIHKSGGILPLVVLGIIGAITAATATAAGTAAGVASTIKTAKDIENERKKTEAYVEATKGIGKGLYLSKGKGLYLAKGNGLYLGKGDRRTNSIKNYATVLDLAKQYPKEAAEAIKIIANTS